MEANEYGCLSQALTVAAMLSAETTLLPGRRLVHLESFVLDAIDSFSFSVK